MAQEWYAQWEVTTKSGRLLKKAGKVSDPAKHFGEFIKRFYPTAVKIEFWETDDKGENPGVHRIVEFNDDGTVKSRTPDIDSAHVGGKGWEADPLNTSHSASGTSRAGLDPRKVRDVGWNPTQHEEDEYELIGDKLQRVLPEAAEQPEIKGVNPTAVNAPEQPAKA